MVASASMTRLEPAALLCISCNLCKKLRVHIFRCHASSVVVQLWLVLGGALLEFRPAASCAQTHTVKG